VPIFRLSENILPSENNGNTLMMVGSFAPVHNGHFDAMESAEKSLIQRGEIVSANVFAPNSDSYVSVKLDDSTGIWNFQRRVNEFRIFESHTRSPAYVDDLTGINPPELSISEEAMSTAALRLGIEACRVILVVGSDQIDSMKPHLNSNRAICVVRPGTEAMIRERLEEKWFRDAVGDGSYLMTNRRFIDYDISSTQIRASSSNKHLVGSSLDD